MNDIDLIWTGENGALNIRYHDGRTVSFPAPRFWRLRQWMRRLFSRPASAE